MLRTLRELKKPEICEMVSPVCFLLFALKLVFVDVFASAPAYRFAGYLPRYCWLAVFLLVCVLQISATTSKKYSFRVVMLNVSACIWLFWSGSIYFAGSNGLGEIVWFFPALACFWTYHRLKHSLIK